MMLDSSVEAIAGILLTAAVSLAAGNTNCSNVSACTGEGEYCSDPALPSDGSTVMHDACQCWNSYFKNESGSGCYKPTFYDLRLTMDSWSCGSDEKPGRQPVNCTRQVTAAAAELQLKEYLNHSLPNFVLLEVIHLEQQQQQQQQQQSPDVFIERGDHHLRMPILPMPFIHVLAAVKTKLKNSDLVCSALNNVSNATVHCSRSVKYAEADVLCRSEHGNPCEPTSTYCNSSGFMTTCTCRKGYRPIPGNQWMCLAKCLPSENWDESLKSCKAKCQAASCRNSGECFPTAAGHVCRCLSGYEGIDCGHWSSKKFEELKWVTIGIGIAALLLMLMLVAVISIACCTDKLQKVVFGHGQLHPTGDIERLSCLASLARSVLKDYDGTGEDTMEMAKQGSKGQLPKTCCVHSEINRSTKSNGHRSVDDEKILEGVANESYIPEANYDLDAAEEKSPEDASH